MGDEFSKLLGRAQSGAAGAWDSLFAAAYDDLRILARARLRAGGRHTMLDTTALVHESYLRFVGAGPLHGDDRRAFFAYASRVMRSTITDAVRERLAQCRGGGAERLTLDTAAINQLPCGEEEVIQVHEALDTLAAAEPRLAAVVEMRYFGGYSESQIAETLQVTDRTVRRDWEKARLLLSALLEN
jgi:RNA polymerase sigma factor (TIGR02999 family)